MATRVCVFVVSGVNVPRERALLLLVCNELVLCRGLNESIDGSVEVRHGVRGAEDKTIGDDKLGQISALRLKQQIQPIPDQLHSKSHNRSRSNIEIKRECSIVFTYSLRTPAKKDRVDGRPSTYTMSAPG